MVFPREGCHADARLPAVGSAASDIAEPRRRVSNQPVKSVRQSSSIVKQGRFGGRSAFLTTRTDWRLVMWLCAGPPGMACVNPPPTSRFTSDPRWSDTRW